MSGWIGVDFDGTLAHYDGWQGELIFGKPVRSMLVRVVEWIRQGYEVRIVTARVSKQEGVDTEAVRRALEEWLIEHLGKPLPITDKRTSL